jgi:protein SCO1/2
VIGPLLGALLYLVSAGPPDLGVTQPPPIFREIGFDQRLGEVLPPDLVFRDEGGRTVRLGDYFGRKPLVLNLVYFDCPMLCTVSLSGLASALEVLSFTVGQEFEILTVSFDPRESPAQAAAAKKARLAGYPRVGAQGGWHFLTGDKQSIDQLTRAVGFRYAWDEESKQFAHPAGLLVLTPEGRIARYLFGIEYAPKDLRLALVEAGSGRLGTPFDQVLLYCYKYDPHRGRYSAQILNLVRLAGLTTVLLLGTFVFLMWRGERAQEGQLA